MVFYAVIDTNVLVSAMLKQESVPYQVLEHAFIGNIIPLYNQEILDEYLAVLLRPKFAFESKKVHQLILEIEKRGLEINAESINIELPDPKDRVFYEITMEKRKTSLAFLVTGNTKHFPEEPFVVTPREMLTILEESYSW